MEGGGLLAFEAKRILHQATDAVHKKLNEFKIGKENFLIGSMRFILEVFTLSKIRSQKYLDFLHRNGHP